MNNYLTIALKIIGMNDRKFSFLFSIVFIITIGCNESVKNDANETGDWIVGKEQEEKAILETLNNETKAAFQRDYEGWRENWVHRPTITKTYIDFADSTFSESVGWDEISQFVKTFIEEHPEPETVPKMIDNIDVQLYGNGAWVIYEQQDSLRGLKRETRLMEKLDGNWKIAGMQTTIYGFDR